MTTTFTAGLTAVANSADVASLDRVRRSVADHGQAGRLSVAATSILVDCCRERAVELIDAERTTPAPAQTPPAAAAPAPAAMTGVPQAFAEGEYAAVVATATQRSYDDSGDVLLISLTADVSGEPTEVRVRFDANREVARAAAFRSCGLPTGSDPAQLIGRSCRVLLAAWTSTEGRSRLVVRRWVAAPRAAAASSSSRQSGSTSRPKRSAKPDWETGDDVLF